MSPCEPTRRRGGRAVAIFDNAPPQLRVAHRCLVFSAQRTVFRRISRMRRPSWIRGVAARETVRVVGQTVASQRVHEHPHSLAGDPGTAGKRDSDQHGCDGWIGREYGDGWWSLGVGVGEKFAGALGRPPARFEFIHSCAQSNRIALGKRPLQSRRMTTQKSVATLSAICSRLARTCARYPRAPVESVH